MNGVRGGFVGAWLLCFFLVFTLLSACSGGDSRTLMLAAKSGFYEIGPVDFSFQQDGLPTLNYTSSTARMLYSFYPADDTPQTKPLFVFFNGGPGCATCTGLFGLNTAPHTMDKTRTGGASCAPNPYSFTRLGNLLYLDAPNAGFSYNVTPNAQIEAVRKAEFGAQNFNPYIDAAQMIRALLRFLAEHPSLKTNRVILVGESYGGVRASLMLNLLLFHSRYADGSRIYRDSALVDLIRAHFAAAGQNLTPQIVARQFGEQILVSPLIAGDYQNELAGKAYEQPDSIIFRIAGQTGTTYTPCADAECNPRDNALDFIIHSAGRDVSQYNQSAGYIDDLLAFVIEGLETPAVLSALFSRPVAFIPYLGAVYRDNAYKYAESGQQDSRSVASHPAFARLPFDDRIRIRQHAEKLSKKEGQAAFLSGDTLEDILGTLHPWDEYVVDCNDYVNETFYVNNAIDSGYSALDPRDTAMGELFLQNLALVKTLITNTTFDLVVYAPVISESLKKYPAMIRNVVRHDDGDDGFIDVYYEPGSLPDLQTPSRRTIYFPRYALAGHMVTHNQPDKFFADVQNWLAAPQ